MLHVFEQSGLGKAPYQYRGVTAEPGFCRFCGTFITYRHYYQSADGRLFFVGCECAKKAVSRSDLKQLTLAGIQ